MIDERAALDGFSRLRVAMVLTDARAEDNPIIYVNEAFERTTGYARSAVIGRNCRFLQGAETAKRDVDRIRTAVAAGDDVSVDIQNYRADGRPFLNRLIIAPIPDESGEAVYFLGIQKELRDSERDETAVDAIPGRIRTRVRGDLALILSGLGQVMVPPADSDGERLEAAMSRRIGCLQLVYESMELSDARTDRARGIDLGALASRVATAVAHCHGRRGIRYQQTVERVDVNLDAAVRVSLLISEVLANAFEHAFERMEEGLVDLSLTRLAAGGLRLVVHDDGIGLPPDRPFPDPGTTGGALMQTLAEGLEATLSPVRGAAGTILVIDVPADVTET